MQIMFLLSAMLIVFLFFKELFMYFVWPKLKKRIQAHILALEAIRLHEANQLKNKLQALEDSKVLEVEVEEVEDVPLVWDIVSSGRREPNNIVLEITKSPLAAK